MRASFLIALSLFSVFFMNAQDTLSSKSGENNQMRVVELGSSEAKNNSMDLFIQGQKDAETNYKGYKASGTAVLVTTAIPGYGILLGGLPLLLGETKMPLDENLGYPNYSLMQNEHYATGYRQKAKQIKSKKLLRNYYTGLAVQASYLVFVLSTLIIATVH